MTHNGDDMKHDWKHWIPLIGIYFFTRDLGKETHIVGGNYIIFHAIYIVLNITAFAILIGITY